jgi:hypothetical protein
MKDWLPVIAYVLFLAVVVYLIKLFLDGLAEEVEKRNALVAPGWPTSPEPAKPTPRKRPAPTPKGTE